MKKLFFLGLVSCLAVFCTGCVKYSYNIEIDNNDKIAISKTQAMNMSFFENYDPKFDEKFKSGIAKSQEEFKQRGFEVKEYKDNIYTGITLTKQNLNFNNVINDLKDDFNNDLYAFTIEKSGLNRIYKIHLTYDMQKAMNNISGSETANFNSREQNNPMVVDENEDSIISKTKETDPETGDIIETTTYENGVIATSRYSPAEQEQFGQAIGASLNSVPGLKPVSELTIKIPKKATKHNATKVINDTEYYWDLAGEKQPVEVILEYQKFDYSSIGIILSALVVLGVLGFVLGKAKGGDLNGF